MLTCSFKHSQKRFTFCNQAITSQLRVLNLCDARFLLSVTLSWWTKCLFIYARCIHQKKRKMVHMVVYRKSHHFQVYFPEIKMSARLYAFYFCNSQANVSLEAGFKTTLTISGKSDTFISGQLKVKTMFIALFWATFICKIWLKSNFCWPDFSSKRKKKKANLLHFPGWIQLRF